MDTIHTPPLQVTFRAIDTKVARQLAEYIGSRNVGKSIEIDGETYTLVHISHNTNSFFRSRGLSAYYKVRRSIVRLSDHWAYSTGYPRSHKLNCHSISGKRWGIGPGADDFGCSWRAGKYSWRMLAGIAPLSALNKTCDHFKGK